MSNALLTEARSLAGKPYQIEIEREPGELSPDIPRYTACIREMPYCVAQGFTEEEALQEIRSVLVDYILSLLVRNIDVPEPEITNIVHESEYDVYWPWEGFFVHASKSFIEQFASPDKPLRTFIYSHSA